MLARYSYPIKVVLCLERQRADDLGQANNLG